MSPPKALLIDLSGTLHIGKAATANAVEALGKLQSAGVPFRLASNTTKESKANLLARLSDIGFKDIRPEHLITSLSATADAVVKDGLKCAPAGTAWTCSQLTVCTRSLLMKSFASAH